MKKYKILLCDPPWSYNNWSVIKDKKLNKKVGRMEYPTMTLDDICALGVDEITDKDCILFLWATMPCLDQAMKVIDSWGFKYKCCAFTWVKTTSKGIYSGLGNWTLGNAELCLLATHKTFPKRKKPVKQIVMAQRGKHSSKPPEVRQRIVEMMGDIPRIELFARKPDALFEDETFNGWDVWGNEVESDIELEVLNEK
ncbi:MT-A70 family methyltransferase [Candidatus Oleimmundimicrobium sp.]|uniref:MT-A70 family methyltransferase n=1 Tax=Candidatus Oleimmundimicrobium sp. TaxID=3060597 RepID=UPI0027276CDE|nr:MT-A70 family methyltransferase [Candidatus Oleimmundimicrobium sp.]MDO8885751.1 MT-A70 family methyltransferase [Candidatus Oleimmundimicrobium sp.]